MTFRDQVAAAGTLLLVASLTACERRLADGDYGALLRFAVREHNLRPLESRPFLGTTPKFVLGRALFFDPVLSGPRDVACATCHLLGRGTSDGLPASHGTGAIGLGDRRQISAGRPRQPRNALDLWNRDHNSVRRMFWDGRLEVINPENPVFLSPWGSQLPPGFENLMAVQASLPLAREEEMLGRAEDFSAPGLPPDHRELSNDVAAAARGLKGGARLAAVSDAVLRRLLGTSDTSPRAWQIEYRELFAQAFPDTAISDISIVHLGNALSHFEEQAFATRDSPWDRYLAGREDAISPNAKRGAFLFLGRARCALCHTPPLFSDFEFHSIGVPRTHGMDVDSGRADVTRSPADAHRFRTPPLRNVARTPPYFHNGSETTLDGAIAQHLDPYRSAGRYHESGEYMMTPAEIDAISPWLDPSRVLLSEAEVVSIVAFLRTLSSSDPDPRIVVPLAVPSGLPPPTLAR